MIDQGVVGTCVADFTTRVTRERLRRFAQSIGEARPIYHDVRIARDHDHPDLPIPPTLLASLISESSDTLRWLRDFGVEELDLLHGEQSFRYTTMAFANEPLHCRQEVSDVVCKKAGALILITLHAQVTRGEEHVMSADQTIIVKMNMGPR